MARPVTWRFDKLSVTLLLHRRISSVGLTMFGCRAWVRLFAGETPALQEEPERVVTRWV